MELTPQILNAKVMHKRLLPAENQFTYGVYYLSLPLSQLHDGKLDRSLAINRPALSSFFEKDHGPRDGTDLEVWARDILKKYGLDKDIDQIILVCMPRILGYVFNPVSFWLCLDKKCNLRAVLCEVNNTFGESHTYLCAHADGRVIKNTDWLKADKVFHVSPFLEREGHYTFRFAFAEDTFGVWIDHYDAEQDKKLVTALTGTLTTLSKSSLRKAFWTHPLVTLKTIVLIHWQALKLISKKIKIIRKPQQKQSRISTTNQITKM